MNKLVWNGPAVLAKVMDACEGGIKDTIEEASKQAAAETWVGKTGRASKSVLQHPRPIERRGHRVVGLWGSRLWRYLFIESGTIHMAGGHFLTRAADAHYPDLADKIRRRYG